MGSIHMLGEVRNGLVVGLSCKVPLPASALRFGGLKCSVDCR